MLTKIVVNIIFIIGMLLSSFWATRYFVDYHNSKEKYCLHAAIVFTAIAFLLAVSIVLGVVGV